MRRNTLLKAGLILLFVSILLVGGYFVGRHFETAGTEQRRNTTSLDFGALDRIEYDGKTYVHKSSMTTLLTIGYDQDENEERVGYRSGGQSDFLMVFVIDHSSKTIRRLQIDRDTMTSITTVSVLGKRAGSRVTHICIAHCYGGNEQ